MTALAVFCVLSVLLNVVLAVRLIKVQRSSHHDAVRQARLAVKLALSRLHARDVASSRDEASDYEDSRRSDVAERSAASGRSEVKAWNRVPVEDSSDIDSSGENDEEQLFLAPIKKKFRRTKR